MKLVGFKIISGKNFCTKFDPINDFVKQRVSYHFTALEFSNLQAFEFLFHIFSLFLENQRGWSQVTILVIFPKMVLLDQFRQSKSTPEVSRKSFLRLIGQILQFQFHFFHFQFLFCLLSFC